MTVQAELGENESVETPLRSRIGLFLGPAAFLFMLFFVELDPSNPMVTRMAAATPPMPTWPTTPPTPPPPTPLLPTPPPPPPPPVFPPFHAVSPYPLWELFRGAPSPKGAL